MLDEHLKKVLNDEVEVQDVDFDNSQFNPEVEFSAITLEEVTVAQNTEDFLRSIGDPDGLHTERRLSRRLSSKSTRSRRVSVKQRE